MTFSQWIAQRKDHYEPGPGYIDHVQELCGALFAMKKPETLDRAIAEFLNEMDRLLEASTAVLEKELPAKDQGEQ